MSTILITGAGKGLGREACAASPRPATTCGSARVTPRPARPRPPTSTRASSRSTSPTTRRAAAAQAVRDAGTGLDVLINNAGIAGSRQPVPETTADHLAAVYATNVLGVVRVTHAFLPLLEESENPVIVNVSSGMGSLALTTDPDRVEATFTALAYPSSKAAVTMLSSQYARALPHIRINAVDPGYTATDLNDHSGPQHHRGHRHHRRARPDRPRPTDRHLPGPPRRRSAVSARFAGAPGAAL